MCVHVVSNDKTKFNCTKKKQKIKLANFLCTYISIYIFMFYFIHINVLCTFFPTPYHTVFPAVHVCICGYAIKRERHKCHFLSSSLPGEKSIQLCFNKNLFRPDLQRSEGELELHLENRKKNLYILKNINV